ncbi:MAG: response regulator [Candidatus Omnitrophica bacterium]|nr:response regulator [Candidatus Omnitrophota bacterium]MDE2009737.1 response regulator [Candidatus Omnitrophota bacterium]MDE2213866.1 response regulator [Candidatus Omnitrophota bacterium]MDE2231875.1 response regulator [Candidatus Omnitrophota bacterium]
MIPDERIFAARILAVDDNILNLQILKKILDQAGFIHITTTTDPTKAVDLYKEIRPDLVLLDLNMPKMDGFAVMAQLSILNPGDYLPILVLTAEEESLRFKALQSGAKDFLHKPYERLDVLLRSRNIIEVRLLYKQIKDDNATLDQKVNEQIKEIRDTRLEVIRRLAVAAELRDTGTGQHIYRMSHYSKALALAFGFTKEQGELLFTASPLHDIGKIAIPDSILLKPSRLEPHEFEIIKTHTILGAQMLAGSNSVFLKMAETIALNHHEKWDGSGYPQGIRGEEIPITGRICAVADVFDALSSDRPYKGAWTIEKTMAELRKQKGTHFDPKLIDAFESIQKEIKAVYDQN